MRPKDLNRVSLDPRDILRSGGKEALANMLKSVGYVPQAQTLNDLALALRRYRPLLLGGKRGTGKTAIAEDLALLIKHRAPFFRLTSGLIEDQCSFASGLSDASLTSPLLGVISEDEECEFSHLCTHTR